MTQQRWSPELTRIDIHAEYELRYWSEKFAVPKDEILATVKTEGFGNAARRKRSSC
jgi:hypothetical protein